MTGVRTPEQAAQMWALHMQNKGLNYMGKPSPRAQLEAAKRAYVAGHITIDLFERRAEVAILAGA